MKTQAAILVETGQPLVVEELEIPALKPGQVLVEVAFSGVCHTQVGEARGYRGKDPFLPHCMGHEGSGTVVEAGPGITKVKSGDRVLLSWIKGSGADVPGTLYTWNGKQVNAGGVTTFNRHAVVSENRLTKLPAQIEMANASFLGCAAPTGLGAVFNTGQARPGMTAAVFGAGGIGLCAVSGAAIAGASRVIAIDINKEKLEVARKMGATHVIDASSNTAAEELMKAAPGGVDLAIEATGRTEVMALALQSVKQQGGIAVVVGNAKAGEHLSFDPKQLNMGKQLRGTWGGDNVPDRDFPKYFDLVQSNRLDLSPLSSKRYSLAEINAAIDDLADGRTVRPVIDMSL